MQKETFSIIVPVLRETDGINPFIDNLAGLKNANSFEIIVVDGEPGCSTINAIKRNDVVKHSSPPGRGRQMNAGAAIAKGKILIFLHADTRLPPDALEQIENTLKNECVAGAFDLEIESEHWFIKIVSAAARFRSRLTRVPYGDQVIFIKKKYFNYIGRFKEIPLMEDVELMKRIKNRNGKICILEKRIKTSDRRWKTKGLVYTTLLDILIPVLFKCGISSDRLAKLYWR